MVMVMVKAVVEVAEVAEEAVVLLVHLRELLLGAPTRVLLQRRALALVVCGPVVNRRFCRGHIAFWMGCAWTALALTLKVGVKLRTISYFQLIYCLLDTEPTWYQNVRCATRRLPSVTAGAAVRAFTLSKPAWLIWSTLPGWRRSASHTADCSVAVALRARSGCSHAPTPLTPSHSYVPAAAMGSKSTSARNSGCGARALSEKHDTAYAVGRSMPLPMPERMAPRWKAYCRSM